MNAPATNSADTTPAAPRCPVDERYRERIAAASQEIGQLSARDRSWNVVRIAVTLALFPAGLLVWQDLLPFWALGLHAVAAVAIALRHERILEQLQVARALETIHRRQLARRHRRWDDFPVPAVASNVAQQAVARDLDLFGKRSVFHWLCVAYTPRGRELLADWLVQPADLAELAHRQQVVRALATEFSWREALQLHGSLLGSDADTGRRFVAWAAEPGFLAQRPWLVAISRFTPLVAIMLYGAWHAAWLSPAAALAGAAVVLIVNTLLSVAYVGTVHDLFQIVSGRSDQVSRYRDMLAIAAQLPEHVGPLTPHGSDPRDTAVEGIRRLSQLRRIVRVADARRDGLFGALVFVAQLLFLWEFHVLAWLESWQRRYGREADNWFRTLAELEALASLATAAHDQPDWSFPHCEPTADRLRARALGHPLIADERRVTNDVELGPAGTFLLVTGSNMSGKSTLLRSLGVNVVLGQAGGVVCAAELSFPPVEVQTSMRVSDSLADGVSLFFAELLRLKEVVDRGAAAARSGRVLLYLLDEILHGTNSRERHTAVARVVRHLLDHQALGAISTHDLELAHSPEIRAACQVVHFRETLDYTGGQQSMTFDYRLRPGLSPTTNALVLLEMVGLTQEPPAPGPGGPPATRGTSSD
ncbi:MAG: hypothetical protein U0935_05150 [Pirellulales bacterium]